MQADTDTRLREIARKRVEFRIHLIVYCVVNGALWLIWLFTSRNYMWPVWPMGIWGTGLAFHYLFEYHSSRFLSEDEEYRKLKRQVEDNNPMAQ